MKKLLIEQGCGKVHIYDLMLFFVFDKTICIVFRNTDWFLIENMEIIIAELILTGIIRWRRGCSNEEIV